MSAQPVRGEDNLYREPPFPKQHAGEHDSKVVRARASELLLESQAMGSMALSAPPGRQCAPGKRQAPKIVAFFAYLVGWWWCRTELDPWEGPSYGPKLRKTDSWLASCCYAFSGEGTRMRHRRFRVNLTSLLKSGPPLVPGLFFCLKNPVISQAPAAGRGAGRAGLPGPPRGAPVPE